MFKSLDLVASENKQSPLVRVLHLSEYGEKYYLSNSVFEEPSDSPYPIDDFFPKLLTSGNRLLAQLFNAQWCDPRPLSGTHAMNCLLAGFTNIGDKIMVTPEINSGHFATVYMAERLGLYCSYFLYDRDNFAIDPTKSAEIINQLRPSILTLDVSHVLFPHPLRELRSCLDYSPLIAYDASHILGLLVNGVFQSPFDDGADIVHGGTHKSFPGPQKAIFLGNAESIRQKVDDVLFPRFSSNFHLHHVLSLYGAVLEALVFGEAYARNIIENSQELARCLYEAGLPVMAVNRGFTQSHQVWLDMSVENVVRMNANGIRATAFVIPGTDGKEKGVRIGTQAITRMGLKKGDMSKVAEFIVQSMAHSKTSENLRKNISHFVGGFEGIHYAFETIDSIATAHPVGELLVEHISQTGLCEVFELLANSSVMQTRLAS